MTVPIQIRNVPDDTHSALTRAAALRGQSLQAFLLGLLENHARALRNADLFHPLAPIRIELPETAAPERLMRLDRQDGFDAAREEYAR